MTQPRPESQGFTILLRALCIFGCVMAVVATAVVGIVASGVAIVGDHSVCGAILVIEGLFFASLFVATVTETP